MNWNFILETGSFHRHSKNCPRAQIPMECYQVLPGALEAPAAHSVPSAEALPNCQAVLRAGGCRGRWKMKKEGQEATWHDASSSGTGVTLQGEYEHVCNTKSFLRMCRLTVPSNVALPLCQRPRVAGHSTTTQQMPFTRSFPLLNRKTRVRSIQGQQSSQIRDSLDLFLSVL